MDAPSGRRTTTTEAKVNGGYPLSWQLDRYARDQAPLLTDGADVAVPPHRASDLLQNCDLPPPLKVVFPATPKGIGDGVPVAGPPYSPSPKQLFLRKTVLLGCTDADAGVDQGGEAQDHLLKALRLSQTRAREAERKAAALGEENKQMASLLVESSLRLYAHRQWLKMAEMENAWLRREVVMAAKEGQVPTAHAVGPPAPGGRLVLVVCLGIAGLGLVIGCCRFML